MMETTLHTDDLVASRFNAAHLGVVEKTHGDVDTHEPYPGRVEPDRITYDKAIRKPTFNQFMKDGIPPKATVLVRWQHTPSPQLIPESKLVPLDRSLLIGDVVKKDVRDAMSGVVVNTFTKCTLQPMCDLSLRSSSNRRNGSSLMGLLPQNDAIDSSIREKKPPPVMDVPASELKYVEALTEDELVLYKDWIGQIDTVTSAIALRLHDNCVVEIEDDLAEHADGALENFYVGDIASTKKGHLRNGRWIYGQYNANTLPLGTVVQTRNIAAEITWLQRRIGSSENEREPPSLLERDELESGSFQVYDRTRKPQQNVTGTTSETISNSEIGARLGLRVTFKDLSGACVKYDGSSGNGKVPRIDRKDTLGYDLNVFDVIKFQTYVSIQWQDLSITRERSIELVPDIGIDDQHAAWPGEIAHTLDLSPVPNLMGVTQPGKVGVVQNVNASERMARVLWCPEACLQYTEDVEDDPGNRSLLTSIVGPPGTEQEDVSLYDVEAPGAMNVRRGDIVLITNRRWKGEESHSPPSEGMEWLGEIVDTCLARNAYYSARCCARSPRRQFEDVRTWLLLSDQMAVTRSMRGMITDMDEEWESGSEDESDMEDDEEEEHEEYSQLAEDYEAAMYHNDKGELLDLYDVEDEDWESDDGEDEECRNGRGTIYYATYISLSHATRQKQREPPSNLPKTRRHVEPSISTTTILPSPRRHSTLKPLLRFLILIHRCPQPKNASKKNTRSSALPPLYRTGSTSAPGNPASISSAFSSSDQQIRPTPTPLS